MERVTFALAKGRLGEKGAELLEQAGVDCSVLLDQGRKLMFEDASGQWRFLLVKPSDVTTYVDHGVADIGIVGKDTLMESGAPLYEMLDLGYGACKLCICGYPEQREKPITNMQWSVGTKYPRIARSYYASMGRTIDIIELHGSVELAPILGLSDVILDIVESGRTLVENGLVVLEEICDVSARLVVNRVSLKTKGKMILPLVERLSSILQGGKL